MLGGKQEQNPGDGVLFRIPWAKINSIFILLHVQNL